MKNTRIYSIIILLSLITAIACETDITVDLPEPEDKLIVEGRIDQGGKARVFLSSNIGYFEPVSIPEISESTDISQYVSFLEESMGLIYDSTIVITVNNGQIIDSLKPSFIPEFPYFGYRGSEIVGEEGQNYRLDIAYKDKKYWAETYIPQAVQIDSVWYTFAQDNDTLGFLHFLFQDPVNVRNFYSMELQTVGEHTSYFPPYFGSFAFDDAGLDGDTIRYTPLTKAYDGNDFFQAEFEEEGDFENAVYHKFGSTVNLKLSSIDKQLFVFWMSFFKHLGTAGNPFTNPATLDSNIMGDKADGYWGGYGFEIKTVTIDSSLVVNEQNNN
ncbi:MAG: DUF4249 family protein [Bacteroidales bacterium]